MEHLELFPKKLAKLVKFTPLKKKISQKFPIFFLGPKNDKICFLKMTVPFHSIAQEESQLFHAFINQPPKKASKSPK
jgi:hypothetical protein